MRAKHYKKLFSDCTLRLNSSNLSTTLMWITIEREIIQAALNMFLKVRIIEKELRKFIKDEITNTNASSVKHTAKFILKVSGKEQC